MRKISGKKILIVGGSEGIGRSIAMQLAPHAKVTIVSRNEEKLERAKKDISQTGAQVESFSLDITDSENTDRVLKSFIANEGTPDMVFNSAGYSHPAYFIDTSIEDCRKMMNLNYFGIVNTLKALVPGFIERGSGHIVNVSSMAGFLGLFGYSGYCATKFAVVGFSEALRRELKPSGIDVSVVCPPGTSTPGFDEENRIKPQEVLKMEKGAKVLTPDEVASATIKGVLKKKFLITPSFDGKLAYYLNRYSPLVLEQFLKRK